MKKRILGLLTMFLLCFFLLPTAQADEDKTQGERSITYIGADGQTKTCSEFTEISDAPDSLSGGWYAVKGDVRVSTHGLYAADTVNLILCDGAELHLEYGLLLNNGAVLNIYGQSGGTGKLTALGKNGGPAIGLGTNSTGGAVNIYGGTVTAQALHGAQAIGRGVKDQSGTLQAGTLTVAIANDLSCVKTDFDPVENAEYGNTDGVSVTISAPALPAAECSGRQYVSLQNAINAAADGDTVTLLHDVTVTETLYNFDSAYTLDLNGKTITGNILSPILRVDRDVTICDSSQDGTGAMVNLLNNISAGVIKQQYGDLTIQGGTFRAASDLASALSSSVNGGLSIQGGTFESECTLYSISHCISGGTFSHLYTDATVADLLQNGYGFKHTGENADWLSAEELGDMSVRSITVEALPTGSALTVTADQAAYFYGDTITLTAELSGAGTPVQYQWYKIASNTTPRYDHFMELIDGATEATYTLTDLASNYCDLFGYYRSYTYYCAATCGDYVIGRSVSFTVEKADIGRASITITTPTYSGAAQSPAAAVKLGDKTLAAGTDYTVTAVPQTDAGTYTLTIAGAGNYTGTVKQAWSIAPIKIDSVMAASPISKVYDGTAAVTLTREEWAGILKFRSLSALDPIPVPSSAYTISDASFQDGRGGTYYDSPAAGGKDALAFHIAITSPNYVLQNFYDEAPVLSKDYVQSGGADFTITQAAAPAAKSGALTIANGQAATYFFNLSSLLPELTPPCRYGGAAYGKPAADLGVGTSVSGVDSEIGVLTLAVSTRNSSAEGPIGTITVPVTTTNYQTFDLTIDVSAANKLVPEVQGAVSTSVITYGDALCQSALSGAMKNSGTDVLGTFAWQSPNSILSAGTHGNVVWKFTPSDTAKYVEVSGLASVQVDRATPTGEPKYTAITADGRTLSDAGLTTEGGTFSVPGTVTWVNADGTPLAADTEVKANTAYRWVFTPTDSSNYTATEGSITLYHISSGGGSASAYPVDLSDKMKNGSVTVSPKRARRGDTVTITVKPDSGYALETVTVTDKSGAELKLTDRGGGKYTFTMPSSGVKVQAAFLEDNSVLNFFYDVPNDAYYYEAVRWAVGKQLTSGIGGGLFGPDGTCTRAQLVTMLWCMTDKPVADYLMPFSDVEENAWYAEAVRWAASEKIVTGTSAATFDPDGTLTRAQAVTILWRYARVQGMDTTQGGMAIREFDDFDTLPAYAGEAMAWAVNANILKGADHKLLPNDACTRAQIVALLYRCMK